MEELRHALHAAADDPPPTRIDLDQIIDGTRRYSRVQYRVGMVAGLTVMAAGAVLVPAVLSSSSGNLGGAGPGAHPSGSCTPYSPGVGTPWAVLVPDPLVPSASRGAGTGDPSYDPSVPEASRLPGPTDPAQVYSPVVCDPVTACPALAATTGPQSSRPADPLVARTREECSVAVVRLSSAVAVAMADTLPGWGVTSSVEPGYRNTDWVFLRQASDASTDGYVASLGVANGSQTSDLLVELTLSGPREASGGCARQQLQPADTCRVTARGDVLLTSPQSTVNLVRPSGSSTPLGAASAMAGGLQTGPDGPPTSYVVTDIRPDGTKVTVSSHAPLTTGQLEAFAQSPGLTLFP